MEIYLDNGATTKVYDSVKDKMVEVLIKDYGNPSSMHNKGFDAEKYVRETRNIIGQSLRVEPKEIFFTSGGTEANNLALIGTAMANKRSGNHIVTTTIEHSSVLEPLKYLSNNGFNIDYLPVNQYGKVIINELYNLINKNTIILSIIYVNNEIGSVQELEKIIQIAKEINKNIIIHVDGIQAYGKINLNPRQLGIDLLSISGHKIHGPKGIGAVYIRKGIKVNPIIFGGGQEQGLRSGTENVPAIAGFGQAIVETFTDLDDTREYLYSLKTYFINEIIKIEGIAINGLEKKEESFIKDTAPHIVSVGFKGVRGEVLLHALAEEGIFVSAGSACSSNQPKLSSTLNAINLNKDYLSSTLRFSFNKNITIEDIDNIIKNLKKLLPKIRRYQPR